MTDLSKIPMAPADAIFGVVVEYTKDPREQKYLCTPGYFFNEEKHAPIFSVVKEAEKRLIQEEENKHYLPIDGPKEYNRLSFELVLGEEKAQEVMDSSAIVATPGGTGALYLAMQLTRQYLSDKIYLSAPTWPNHTSIARQCLLQVEEYPYFKDGSLDFEGMCAFFHQLEEGSVILLQASCHNPTGKDPTDEQWDALIQILRERSLFPIVDCAYQGFGRSMQEDVYLVRALAEQKIPFLLTYSFSKNFSIYGERVGFFAACTFDPLSAKAILSQAKAIARATYSNPPLHGIVVVEKILGDEALKRQWLEELENCRQQLLHISSRLSNETSMPCFDQSYGFFNLTGLKPKQVERLKEEWAVYLTKSGRLTVSSITEEMVKPVSHALRSV